MELTSAGLKAEFTRIDDSVSPETPEVRTMAMIMHGLQFVGLPIVGPLIIWLVKRDESRFIDVHFRELMNWHISYFVLGLAAGALSFVCIGIPFLIALAVAAFALPIVAIIRASEGKVYRFPFVYRLF